VKHVAIRELPNTITETNLVLVFAAIDFGTKSLAASKASRGG
jgi:hypothetical protein